MDSKERDYMQRLAQAQAQADGNPQVMGLQQPGYYKPEPAPQISTSANTPVEQRENMSGDLEQGTSMTERVANNPEDFQTDALDKRLGLYASALGNAHGGNNDRAKVVGLD
jgi:hypothetical protein